LSKFLQTIRTKYQVSTIGQIIDDMEKQGLVYDEESAYIFNEVTKENGI